jgi:hypothetical protein
LDFGTLYIDMNEQNSIGLSLSIELFKKDISRRKVRSLG